jgi:hypothetical protein
VEKIQKGKVLIPTAGAASLSAPLYQSSKSTWTPFTAASPGMIPDVQKAGSTAAPGTLPGDKRRRLRGTGQWQQRQNCALASRTIPLTLSVSITIGTNICHS